jgi:hypothetical protein
MSYSLAKGKWEVRWRDGDGRQRSRTFDDQAPAQAFDEAIHDQNVKERNKVGLRKSGGVYPYQTAQGARWRCKVKRSDGTWTQKRGFTSPSAAANWRRRQLERVERREVVHTKETFGEFFPRSAGVWVARISSGAARGNGLATPNIGSALFGPRRTKGKAGVVEDVSLTCD